MLVLGSWVWGKTIYVDDDAASPGDGTSWITAYRFLQDALTDANNSPGPVQILVAQGTYKPDRSSAHPLSTRKREASFTLPADTTLMGGYAGSGARDPNIRDVTRYATVLSGDLANDDIPIEDPWPPFGEYPTRIDNSFCIVTFDVADANATLDGIVITRTSMYRPYGEPYPARAAGLYVGRHARVAVRNCVFVENLTSGIRCFGVTELSVVDCTFRDNVAYDGAGGGGIHVHAVTGTTHVIGCTFERNLASDGGGIYNWSDWGHLEVEDCIFRENATPGDHTGFGMGPYVDGNVGGALHSYGSGELRRCQFQSNHAAAGGAASLKLDWTISDCAFRDNWAHESAGALFLQGANKEISRCTFTRNACHWEGGAIANWGCHVDFAQCLFAGNTAIHGGVVYARDVANHLPRALWTERGFRLALSNCTVADNLSGEGPRIWCKGWYVTDESAAEGNALSLSNCILDDGGDELRYRGRVQIDIDHTNLRDGLDSIQDPCECVVWGPGNLDVDPLFAREGYWDANGTSEDPSDDFFVEGDYHLKSQIGRWDPINENWVQDDVASPCIDAGDPNSSVGDEPFPNGAIINMGAYGGTIEASKSPISGE